MLAQRKLESQPSFKTIGNGDDASVNQNGMFNNGESKSCSAFLAGASFIYTIKAFEEIGELVMLNALPVIFKSDATRLLIVFKQRDVDFRTTKNGEVNLYIIFSIFSLSNIMLI